MTVINPLDDNTDYWAAWPNAWANALADNAILNGCATSKGSGDWDIDVTAGRIVEGGTEASISSGTVTITDASALSAGESRVTVVTADTGDALASTDGTAAANPATPDIPSGEVLLGFVVVANGDATAADADIFDVPAMPSLPTIYSLSESTGSTGTVRTITVPPGRTALLESLFVSITNAGGNSSFEIGIKWTYDDASTANTSLSGSTSVGDNESGRFHNDFFHPTGHYAKEVDQIELFSSGVGGDSMDWDAVLLIAPGPTT